MDLPANPLELVQHLGITDIPPDVVETLWNGGLSPSRNSLGQARPRSTAIQGLREAA
jgi:hypothetical protein